MTTARSSVLSATLNMEIGGIHTGHKYLYSSVSLGLVVNQRIAAHCDGHIHLEYASVFLPKVNRPPWQREDSFPAANIINSSASLTSLQLQHRVTYTSRWRLLQQRRAPWRSSRISRIFRKTIRRTTCKSSSASTTGLHPMLLWHCTPPSSGAWRRDHL